MLQKTRFVTNKPFDMQCLDKKRDQLILDATVQRPNGSIVSVKQFSQSENPNSVGCFSYSSENGDLLRVTKYGWMLNSEEVFLSKAFIS